MNDANPETADNPFFQPWDGPFGVPPFARIKTEHFMPAFTRAMAEHDAEMETIAADSSPATFENVIVAFERAGRLLDHVLSVFHVLTGADTSEALQALERDIMPKLAAHGSRIYLNPRIYARLEAVYQQRERLPLTPEQRRVLEDYYTDFRRQGAHLGDAAKKRLAEISERLATLGTAFGQNVLADEQGYMLILESEADLAGLSEAQRAAAKQAAEARGLPGKYVITLSRSSADPFLQFSARRDLREKLFRAYVARGDNGGKTDNKAIIAETVALRAERARLLGYRSFADYRLDDSMAKTPQAVRGLLDKVWPLARARALADRDAMQKLIAEEGGNFKLAAWDWRYYAEKLRKKLHDVDEAAIKPYLQLEKVIAAAFDTAHRLFGLNFAPLPQIKGWHPDVRVWEVTDEQARHVGLFFGDYFARPSKRSGAWMSNLREQERLNGEISPHVYNVMNFSKASSGPSLLSFDDARTLFHEFGHALHGLLSNVTYRKISGTNVKTDFVELPSQLYEHWFERPEVLRRFALHYQTGEPMPEELLERLLAARTFNQGFATVEYVSSALVDLEFHALEKAEHLDVASFEKDALARIGMPEEIMMRHRPPHFQHIFSGGGYASAYYSYMWSEVLDADAFRAFEEAGNIFDPVTARKLRNSIYAAGGLREPADAYIAFRGKLPTPDALLARRGLIDAAPAGDA